MVSVITAIPCNMSVVPISTAAEFRVNMFHHTGLGGDMPNQLEAAIFAGACRQPPRIFQDDGYIKNQVTGLITTASK